MVALNKNIRCFTLIRPAATFSLSEKEWGAHAARVLPWASRPRFGRYTRLAKREAPAGRHEIARGVSPGYDVPKKSNKPRRVGTKTNTDGQDKYGILGRGGTRPSRSLAKLPLGEGRGEGERTTATTP